MGDDALEHGVHGDFEIPGETGAKERIDVLAEVGQSPLAMEVLFVLCTRNGVATLPHVALEAGDDRRWVDPASLQGVPEIEEIAPLLTLVESFELCSQQLVDRERVDVCGPAKPRAVDLERHAHPAELGEVLARV